MIKNQRQSQRETRIFTMRRQGYALRDIAAAVGCSHEWVRVLLNRTGRFDLRVPLRNKRVPRVCSIPGCLRKHCGRGYCAPHLARLNAGTMDKGGNPLPARLTCRLCGKGFEAPRSSAARRMCDRCRPPLPHERMQLKDFANKNKERNKKIRLLFRRGAHPETIGQQIGLSSWTIRSIVRYSGRSRSSPAQQRVKAGLCHRCGERRNKSASYCDHCHEVAMVRQRDRIRRRYRESPRCNAIGCRSKVFARGFCRNCHAAWKRGKIDNQGKHRLSVCRRCPCKFIPDREGQKLCRLCAAKA